MSEVIKFRAWIIPTKRMVEVTGLCWQTKGLAVECLKVGRTDLDNKLAQEFWWNEKEAVLLKPTGLRDSREKHIYEGDIIQDEDGGKAVVEFYKDRFSYRYESWPKNLPLPHDFAINLTIGKGFKIIGNVWENPELVAL